MDDRPLTLLLAGLVTLASFSSGTAYQLKSYSIGSGGSNSAASATYDAQVSAGEQSNNSSAGTTYTAGNGGVQTEQLNVPGVPTLDTNGGTYYDRLKLTINTSNNPSDTTYSVAISTDNFTTTNYVQADGTIGATRVYQSYTSWGGSGGSFIIGLAINTTYYVKVDAMEGLFTNTEYSSVANATTATPTLSFSVSPNSSNYGSILSGVVTTSSNISFTFSTNGDSGGNIYVRGANPGFKSPSLGYTVTAVSGDLSLLSSGFGIQGTNPNQTSGGPLSIVSPFNGTGNVVGAESTSFAQMFTSSAALAGGTASANVQVKPAGSAPPANDYAETFTFIASASF